MPESYPEFAKLVNTVALLRAPGGCPWDREQTHSSLTECLIEECAELIEAIDHLDYPHMQEELGDVLLNVLMQSEIAAESGNFNIEDVSREINDKLIRRHPHVFDKESFKADNSGEVLKRWEEIKASEAKNGKQTPAHSPFKPLPPELPASLYAKKTFKHIQKAQLEKDDALPQDKIQDFTENYTEEELGSALFAISAACRLRSIDPEKLLRTTTQNLVNTLSQKVEARA